MGLVDIATWNVNSVRARLPRLLAWLARRRPDVVCLQETKVVDESFPREPIEELGYHCVTYGQKTYNGVAILSLAPAAEVARGLPGDEPEAPRRVIGARISGVRVLSVYAPNGGDVDRPTYPAKLKWYQRLREWLDGAVQPGEDLVLCGDLNVAPEERDVWDADAWRGKILFSEPEKQALAHLAAWGLIDVVRLHHPETGLYTWWDYRAGAFHRGWGLRIDHILASAPMARRCSGALVDRKERAGEKPSDHAPVIATFAAS
jgi:exodeoxyribonuclease-3